MTLQNQSAASLSPDRLELKGRGEDGWRILARRREGSDAGAGAGAADQTRPGVAVVARERKKEQGRLLDRELAGRVVRGPRKPAGADGLAAFAHLPSPSRSPGYTSTLPAMVVSPSCTRTAARTALRSSHAPPRLTAFAPPPPRPSPAARPRSTPSRPTAAPYSTARSTASSRSLTRVAMSLALAAGLATATAAVSLSKSVRSRSLSRLLNPSQTRPLTMRAHTTAFGSALLR